MYSDPFLSIDYYSKHADIVILDNNSNSHEKLIYYVNIQCKYSNSTPIIYIDTAQVFNYMNTLLELKNKKGDKHDLIKPLNRNFRNAEHWNLNHEILNPLKEFLKQYFE